MKTIRQILYREIFLNRWSLFLTLVLMLLIVGLDVISPWPFKILIDNVLASNPVLPDSKINTFLASFHSQDLLGFFVVFVYFGSTFFLAIVSYLRSVVSKNVSKKLTSNFSKSAFKNLQTLAIGFYNEQQIGDYIYRLSYDVSALGEMIEDGILPLITSSLYLIVTMVIMFMIDVRLTIFSLAALPFLTVGLYSFNRYIKSATKRSEFFNSAAFSFIEEALAHLKVIQAFSQEHRESKTFDKKIDESLGTDTIVLKLDFLLTLLVGIIIALSYSLIIMYGIRLVFSGVLTTGLLIVFIFYLDNLTNPMLSIVYAVTDLKQAYIKISRMEDFFTKKTHLTSPGKITEIVDSTIKFSNVSLFGTKRSKMLDKISFEIQPNKRTIIFGASGSGKTSVINLILRFISKPSSGDIFIGGVNIKEYDLKSLRDSIAFVPQEVTLFDDTIRNNISFGNSIGMFVDIQRAAKVAVAEEFIEKLPGAYSYRVGEGGNQLSGGQRQRLMLARALMKKDAKILIFDEVFSGLDVKTRQKVLNSIYDFSENKTVIIISNVFDIVRASDQVIVLNKGRVIYSGSSHRLPKEVALYKMMVENE